MEDRSQYRLLVGYSGLTFVELLFFSKSAFWGDAADTPDIRSVQHRVILTRPEAWPSVQVHARHISPPSVFHPNILSLSGRPVDDPINAAQQFFGIFNPGTICYGQAGPGIRLADIAGMIYNMLGYRFGAYSLKYEHFNISAIRWAQKMEKVPGFFPLERSALLGIEKAGNEANK